jgi:hypothetical protein
MLGQSGQIKAALVASGVSFATILEVLTGWVGFFAALGALFVTITLALKNRADTKKSEAIADREHQQMLSLKISNETDRIELTRLREQERQRIAASMEHQARRIGDSVDGIEHDL